MSLEKVRATDSELAGYIDEELERQQNTIELIASENFTSPAVMEACGTVLTNKYAEGKPQKRGFHRPLKDGISAGGLSDLAACQGLAGDQSYRSPYLLRGAVGRDRLSADRSLRMRRRDGR